MMTTKTTTTAAMATTSPFISLSKGEKSARTARIITKKKMHAAFSQQQVQRLKLS